MSGNTSTVRTDARAYRFPRPSGAASTADTIPGQWGGLAWPTETTAPVPTLSPRGARMVDRWPLRSFLELGAYPTAVSCARLHAKHVLREWCLAHISHSAELLISELMTNAIRASMSEAGIAVVRLWLLSNQARLLIMVQDDSIKQPVRAEPDMDAESGRGLLLVEAVSERWDWYLPEGASGKVVWCLLPGSF